MPSQAPAHTPVPIVCHSPVRAIGQTEYLYHLACQAQALGLRVLLYDLDPQGMLTQLCKGPDDPFWTNLDPSATSQEITSFSPEPIEPGLDLVPVPFFLQTPPLSMIHGLLEALSEDDQADLVLIDTGPDLPSLTQALLEYPFSWWLSLPNRYPVLNSIQVLFRMYPAWGQQDRVVWQWVLVEQPNRNPRIPGLYPRDYSLSAMGTAFQGPCGNPVEPAWVLPEYCMRLLCEEAYLLDRNPHGPAKPLHLWDATDGMVGSLAPAHRQAVTHLEERVRSFLPHSISP